MNHPAGIPHEAEPLMLFLLEEGSRADAIRLYQEETGAHRGDAKRAVAQLARRHGLIASDTGAMDLVALALILLSLAVGFAVS
ncbi:MAG: hypothetical protein A2W31_16040 [Planctomycetes bacterium RBG_16_64_10]|nr:MAG: hypothetical protein A2W31_16040 [Planctomycetes bacterium RBG_16_64_10]